MMKSITDKSYTLHSQHNLTDRNRYETISKDDKEETISELINYFEVLGLQYKGLKPDEIEIMMLVDDDYKIQVEDETGIEKDKIEKVIRTLNQLTSMIGIISSTTSPYLFCSGLSCFFIFSIC